MKTTTLLQLPEWKETGDCFTWGRLSSSVEFFGIPMHLEAIAVQDVNGEQRAIDPIFNEDLDALHAIDQGAWGFCTIEINGREYVLHAQPFEA